MKTNEYLIVAGIAALVAGVLIYMNNAGSLTFLQPEVSGEAPAK